MCVWFHAAFMYITSSEPSSYTTVLSGTFK